jgi:hypothetical protein
MQPREHQTPVVGGVGKIIKETGLHEFGMEWF